MAVIQQYPELIAIVFVGLGFVVAHFLARWSASAVGLFEAAMHRVSPQRADLSPGVERGIARTVYYLTLGFFILLAIRSLGVHLLGEWLDAVIVYIPRLLLGGAIIFGGYLLGAVVRSLVANITDPASGQMLPKLAQYLVLIAAIITGLDQMAVDVSFLATLTVLVLGALLGGLSLAFALGSRDVVANMLSRRELDRYQVGDRVRIENAEGRIVEVSRTGVLLEAEEGLTFVPASRFASSIVVLVGSGQDTDD